jgi:hypothetical protein
MRVKKNDNEMNFKTEGTCRSWIKKNIIQKGGKLGADMLYHMKDGTKYKCFMFGVEIIPKGGKPASGNITGPVKKEKKERKNKRKVKPTKLTKKGWPRKPRSDKGKKRSK